MNLRPFLASATLTAALVSCGPISSIDNNNNGSGSGYLAGVGVTSTTPAGPVNPAEASKFWDGDSVTGIPSIRINRYEQKAYFYKNGELVGVSPVSTGNSTGWRPKGTDTTKKCAKDSCNLPKNATASS